MQQRNLYTCLFIIFLSLLIASNYVKISLIQTNEKLCPCTNLATILSTTKTAIDATDNSFSSYNSTTIQTTSTRNPIDSSLEEKLISRRLNIREICQAKGYKETDIPIHEDKERSSLYRYTAMDVFLCM